MATQNSTRNVVGSTTVSTSAASADQVLTSSSSTAAAFAYPNPAKARIASQAAGDVLYADTTTTWARLAKGSDTNVLTLASGVPTWAAPSGGSQTIYANEAYSFDTIDGWNTGGLTTGTGAVAMDGTNNDMLKISASTTNDIGGIRNSKGISWQSSNLPLNIYGYFAAIFSGATGSGDIMVRALSDANDSGTATANQIGWHVIKSSGTLSAQSSTGDGTTEQAVTLSGYTPNTANARVNRWSFSWDGTTVAFYIDGVLKNSHTTNVPHRTTQDIVYRPIMHVKATSANSFIFWPLIFNLQYPMFGT